VRPYACSAFAPLPGRRKSYFCNFLLQNAQKYAPLTFIFDIGGSFQSLTTIFGGSYLNVGQEARDFTINPFSLPQTKENLQFLFSFFRVLIEGNELRHRLDFKEERRLWEGIERMYVLERNQRTISNFCNIIGELAESLVPGGSLIWRDEGTSKIAAMTHATRVSNGGSRSYGQTGSWPLRKEKLVLGNGLLSFPSRRGHGPVSTQ
jgi:hypothetical protein